MSYRNNNSSNSVGDYNGRRSADGRDGGRDRSRDRARGHSSASNYNANNNYNSNNQGGGKWASAAAAAEEHQRSGGRRYDGWENVDQEEENHDDEGWLARKTRAVQNDSVNTTRRALQKAREADEIADRSLNKLNEQSEQLHRIEHRLDTADSHAKISEAKTAELKALNRWFFLPTFGASKKAKAQEDRLKEEMAEAERRDAERRENVRNGGGYYSGSSSARDLSMRETGRDRSRNGNGRDHRGGGGGGGDGYGYSKSYSTPEGLDRDEMEDEIDNNLDEMSDMLRKLRMKGQVMGQEIESQTSHIRNINDKTDMVRDRVDKVHRDVSAISDKGKKRK